MFKELLPLFIVFGLLIVTIMLVQIGRVRFSHIVSEGHVALLSRNGKFVQVLGPGKHVHWGRKFATRWVDVRKGSLLVPGQEVLTADSVGLKVSLLVAYQVTDPAKAIHETQNWQADLHAAGQIALRTVIGSVALEALLNQRLEIGAQLLTRVQPEGAKIGITVFSVEVRDVTLPNDLKRAFADVLKAKQEGQAALERARGESAALRNLANAARVLEGNPALMNLRLMQSLATAQNAGSTLVLGVPGGFVPLKNGKSSTKEAGDAET